MRVLTIISTIVLPLTFFTGLYGMNVGLPFAEKTWAFWGLIGVCIFTIVFLLFFFKRKKWM